MKIPFTWNDHKDATPGRKIFHYDHEYIFCNWDGSKKVIAFNEVSRKFCALSTHDRLTTEAKVEGVARILRELIS